MITVEVWGNDVEITVIPSDHAQKKDLIVGQTLLYTIIANDWNEAMSEHHKRQGWEPYVPVP